MLGFTVFLEHLEFYNHLDVHFSSLDKRINTVLQIFSHGIGVKEDNKISQK